METSEAGVLAKFLPLEISARQLGKISLVLPRLFTMSDLPDKVSFEALTLLLVEKLALLSLEQLEALAQDWRLAQQHRDSLETASPQWNTSPTHWL